MLSVQAQPTASAGGPYTLCQTGGTLTGSATNQASVSWSDAGGGTFGSPTSLTTTFTPTAAEITAGTATVTLTASNSPCTAATSNATVTIVKSPTANAGGPYTICETGGTLTGSATNQSSVSWSDAGGGTFGSPSSLTTT